MLIDVKNIQKKYEIAGKDFYALRGVDVQIAKGDFVAIMGPSGSGKSTLMHILGLLDKPSSGHFIFDGKDITDYSEDELAELRSEKIGFVFQRFNLLARTSSLDNVKLPSIYNAYEDGSRANDLLTSVGLGDKLLNQPSELSGGQQQRVAIARSLVNNPEVIFADEPTGALDSKTSVEIMELFQKLNEKGITIILVTHEEDVASYASRVIRISDGNISSDLRSKDIYEGLEVERVKNKNDSPIKKYLSFFRQSLKSLFSNKVRTFLSLLGILIGVAAVISIVAIGEGAKKSIQDELAALGSNRIMVFKGRVKTGGVNYSSASSSSSGNSSNQSQKRVGELIKMSDKEVELIKETVPGVKYVVPYSSGKVQVVGPKDNTNTSVIGTTTDYVLSNNAEPIAGRFFTDDEIKRRDKVAVIGLTVLKDIFPEGVNPVGQTIQVNKQHFRVIGVLPEKGSMGSSDQDDRIIIPLDTAMKRVLGEKYFTYMEIETHLIDQVQGAQDQIEKLLISRFGLRNEQKEALRIRNLAEIQQAMNKTTSTFSFFLVCVAGISLLVGGIGIMNIMLVTVTERTREIGLRKAIGAKRFDILSQFLVEALLLGLMGGVLGITIGVLGVKLVSALTSLKTIIGVVPVVVSLGFSMGIGLIFGLWPARKASLMEPVDALRYE